jgi:hypothetical protein
VIRIISTGRGNGRLLVRGVSNSPPLASLLCWNYLPFATKLKKGILTIQAIFLSRCLKSKHYVKKRQEIFGQALLPGDDLPFSRNSRASFVALKFLLTLP